MVGPRLPAAWFGRVLTRPLIEGTGAHGKHQQCHAGLAEC